MDAGTLDYTRTLSKEFQKDTSTMLFFYKYKKDKEYLLKVATELRKEIKQGILKGDKYTSELKYVDHLISL